MAGKPYQQEALTSIETMRRKGMSIPAIAESLGRTQAGIQNKIRVLGLADPVRSKTMRAVQKFTAEQKSAFREFLSTHDCGHTAIDIRDAWNREASVRGCPAVTVDRVRYYRRQSGEQPTKAECLRFESYRQKQRDVQRVRRKTESEARRHALRDRRSELYGAGENLSKRKCQVCRETWPLTDEFFRRAGKKGNYYLNSCKLCLRAAVGNTAEERRGQRMEAYDRGVAVKQISHASCERDAFLQAHRNFPTRRCCRCHETWELLPARFPKYKGANGAELYRKTCRFCLRAAERLKEREKNALRRVPPSIAVYRVSGAEVLQESL